MLSDGLYCSKQCQSAGRKQTREDQKTRTTCTSWVNIRNTVRKRDNWTCQICGKKKGITLHCHHIIPYRASKDNSIDNLITLCSSCHSKEERKYYNSLWFDTIK